MKLFSGLIQKLEVKAGTYLLKQKLPSIINAGGSFLAGWLSSSHILPLLASYGITIDPNRVAASVVTLLSGSIATAFVHAVVGAVGYMAVAPTSTPTPPTNS